MKSGLSLLFVSVALLAQEGTLNVPSPAASQDADLEYVCPMDKDIRSSKPGKCPRCGMTLVAGIPEPVEYPVALTTKPPLLKAGEKAELDFRIEDPRTFATIKDFEIMHEKLFHLFLVSQDLSFFAHIHPQIQPDGTFKLPVTLPKTGMYRVLSDFYPKGATPQLITSTITVPGPGFKIAPAVIKADIDPQHSENLDVELVMDPPKPIAGNKTFLFFRLRPNDEIQPYLGAMAHMLVASSDLVDMIHAHPLTSADAPVASDYKQVQFDLIFPRPGIYRVWVQFQRKNVVNTVAFNVPIGDS